MTKSKYQMEDGTLLKNGVLRLLLSITLVVLYGASMLMGCATARPDPFKARLAAMTDDEIVSYYRGINDRLKEIQAGTREADRQGTIAQDDHIVQMPYIMGGEAWQLEQKRAKVRKELVRRNLTP